MWDENLLSLIRCVSICVRGRRVSLVDVSLRVCASARKKHLGAGLTPDF